MRHCCQDFADAMEGGTDNEGYSSLIKQDHESFDIGNGLRPIRFCPWCGADKTKPDPLQTAAQRVVDTLGPNRDWHELKEAIGDLGFTLERLKEKKT